MQMPSTPWSTMQSSTRRWPSRSSSPAGVKGVGAMGKTPRRAVSRVIMIRLETCPRGRGQAALRDFIQPPRTHGATAALVGGPAVGRGDGCAQAGAERFAGRDRRALLVDL